MQDKSTSRTTQVSYKRRTYKLKGISYMSLSLTYIVLIVLTLIIGLVLLALAASKGNVLGLLLIGTITGGIIFLLVSIGTKYGQYGLEILLAKVLQKKHIKNDFPRIEQQVLQQQELFSMQTLSKEWTSDSDKNTSNTIDSNL